MKKAVIGILAHVDAGKTTLSEALLYTCGRIAKMGRVDNQDAFLDTYALERSRGITIFSKQAIFPLGDIEVTLMDTPGHVDFSAEMERTLQVLDYAILVISGADGVQGHTRTLWQLLEKYHIPVFIFVNKMDQEGSNQGALLAELKSRLDDNCIDFCIPDALTSSGIFYENVAVCDEALLDRFLETGTMTVKDIQELILQRKVFPCYFGSALKLQGVEHFLQGLGNYITCPNYPDSFGARVFKIMRDEQGNRLTHLKVTGGTLRVKNTLSGSGNWTEKVNQIRIYSGTRYETVNEAGAGTVCSVTGLTKTRAGEGLGVDCSEIFPRLEPVLTYQILLPDGCDAAATLPKLYQLQEEDPSLHIVWNESIQEIQAQLMGEVQVEILQSMIQERFGMQVSFGTGKIVYKETILETAEGVGHFEPLRHYAEVHLILEPGEAGSGLVFDTDCPEDLLDKNWQRLVLTHLEEKEHRGVLTGSPITDMRITLVAGRAHQKHTEGGDFRQATYRAVRQGLKQAHSILLEPYYEFHLEVPEKSLGRAMADIERMHGDFTLHQTASETAVLTGSVPVATMQDYHKDVLSYTKGLGKLSCILKGYAPCHNAEQIIAGIGYDAERDLENPTGSVFCVHGAGFVVPWDQVYEYMHIENRLRMPQEETEPGSLQDRKNFISQEWIDDEEINSIFSKTFYANKVSDSRSRWKKSTKNPDISTPSIKRVWKRPEERDSYLLIDGYNIIHAWEDLKPLAKDNIDGARGKLLDILCNYQGIRGDHVIVVFDAYRVAGRIAKVEDYHNIHVVYTKEAETADQYIEKFAHEHARKYDVTVATSDNLEQIIVWGQGCRLLSARELLNDVREANTFMMESYKQNHPQTRHHLLDSLPEDTLQLLHQVDEDLPEHS